MSALEANPLPLQPEYSSASLNFIDECALKFIHSSKISIQAAQSLIDFIGHGRTAAEYVRDGAFKSVLEKMKLHVLEEYASKRLAFLKTEGTILPDDAFPLETIMGIESIKEFRLLYSDVDYPKRRFILLDHERKVGKEKIYNIMK